MRRNAPTADLSPSEHAALADLMIAERDRISGRVRSLARALDDLIESSAGVPADDDHDPEGATIAFERAQAAALLAQARSHLADLDLARERLDAGTYGACARCGRRIVFERLLARPTAQTCVECAAAPGEGA